jgi:hypothetical protein
VGNTDIHTDYHDDFVILSKLACKNDRKPDHPFVSH